jgi:hypothetical protein
MRSVTPGLGFGFGAFFQAAGFSGGAAGGAGRRAVPGCDDGLLQISGSSGAFREINIRAFDRKVHARVRNAAHGLQRALNGRSTSRAMHAADI